MSYITEILSRIEEGDSQAAAQLPSLIYDELCEFAARKMATEQTNGALQGTELVHEVFRRLVESPNGYERSHRGRFFSAAAEALRRILVEQASWRDSDHGDGNSHSAQIGTTVTAFALPLEQLLEFNDALSRLEVSDPLLAKLVKLRVFGGLTIEDAAEIQGVPAGEISRDWTFAEAWLYRAMQEN